MEKLNGKTKKALREIPLELKKLNKIVSVLGEILAGQKIKELKQNKKDFEDLVEQKQVESERKGVS